MLIGADCTYTCTYIAEILNFTVPIEPLFMQTHVCQLALFIRNRVNYVHSRLKLSNSHEGKILLLVHFTQGIVHSKQLGVCTTPRGENNINNMVKSTVILYSIRKIKNK